MRIACETDCEDVPFSKLEPGDVFKLYEWYYVKLLPSTESIFQAVELGEGVLARVGSDTWVTPKPHCRMIFD